MGTNLNPGDTRVVFSGLGPRRFKKKCQGHESCYGASMECWSDSGQDLALLAESVITPEVYWPISVAIGMCVNVPVPQDASFP